MDDTPTPIIVILRRWKSQITKERSIIALFPYEDEGRGRCLSYEHVGQHGPADYFGVVANTTPVRRWDYEAEALDRELRSIGYLPTYRLRYNRHHKEARS